jgi:hypothetical protein
LITDIGDGYEQLAGLAWVDDDAVVNDLRDFRWFPAQPV